jgi:hypothetical protein
MGLCDLLEFFPSSVPGELALIVMEEGILGMPSEYLGGDFGDSMVTRGPVLLGDNGPIDNGLAFGVDGLELPSATAVIFNAVCCVEYCDAPKRGRSSDTLPVPLVCGTPRSSGCLVMFVVPGRGGMFGGSFGGGLDLAMLSK